MWKMSREGENLLASYDGLCFMESALQHNTAALSEWKQKTAELPSAQFSTENSLQTQETADQSTWIVCFANKFLGTTTIQQAPKEHMNKLRRFLWETDSGTRRHFSESEL